VKQFIYQYDVAGNRTSEQIQSGAGASPAVGSASYNNLNQLTSRTGNSGQIRFRGSLDSTGTVTVAGSPAPMLAHTNFTGYANVSQGTNVISVVASDYSGHSATNKYQVVVTNNGVAETITYDLNGNETSVVTATSTNTYQWDAADRLIQITQLSTNNTQLTSIFAYDGFGRRTQITELQNGVAVSTNRFFWCGVELCEQRDFTGGIVTKRFFGQGEQISGINYYFTKDHLGSIREMVDNNGTIQARYDYDPYGRRTKISGSLDADFGFTGHYFHAPSGLCLTFFRAYDSDLGRWLSRDPIEEKGGLNVYSYVFNDPINAMDPDGRSALVIAACLGIGVLAIGLWYASTKSDQYNDIRRNTDYVDPIKLSQRQSQIATNYMKDLSQTAKALVSSVPGGGTSFSLTPVGVPENGPQVAVGLYKYTLSQYVNYQVGRENRPPQTVTNSGSCN
jgi:RHS repeat-associated protein